MSDKTMPAGAPPPELRGFSFNTLNAAPDGVTPDEWRRTMGLLATALLSQARGGEFLTLFQATQRAARLADWIRTGEVPDA